MDVAGKEKAVSEGEFFDLMYANMDNGDFNPHSQYAFMRKSGNEVLLVVANFSGEDRDCGVIIPKHAFDFLEIGEQNLTATDLLSGDTLPIQLKADGKVKMQVKAYGGRAYKFKV